MVSGLVTSPCDQLRIFSGEARLIRMESKSAIKFALSYGEDRYMKSPIKTFQSRRLRDGRRQKTIVCPTSAANCLVCRERSIRYFPRLFHQLDVQTERLQLAYQDVEGFGHARLGGRFTLHDCFVNLGASVNV